MFRPSRRKDRGPRRSQYRLSRIRWRGFIRPAQSRYYHRALLYSKNWAWTGGSGFQPRYSIENRATTVCCDEKPLPQGSVNAIKKVELWKWLQPNRVLADMWSVNWRSLIRKTKCNDTACSIPIAIDAGLGELARNGLLITPAFGPRVRLAKVFTDLPLIPDTPIEFGVWDFCMKCEKCAQRCPSQSILYGKPTEKPNNISNREGLLRWPINAETCLAFWAANGTDCANCIRTCPFNKPTGRIHDTVRWGIKNFPFLNPLFLWGDDLLGYGKRRKADKFWME